MDMDIDMDMDMDIDIDIGIYPMIPGHSRMPCASLGDWYIVDQTLCWFFAIQNISLSIHFPLEKISREKRVQFSTATENLARQF